MNVNQKFVIWCVKQCLHLWDPPKEVLVWLDDPENDEKALMAKISALTVRINNDNSAASSAMVTTAWAASGMSIMIVATQTKRTLNTTTDKLRFDFVATLTDEELNEVDPEWIDYMTVELFSR